MTTAKNNGLAAIEAAAEGENPPAETTEVKAVALTVTLDELTAGADVALPTVSTSTTGVTASIAWKLGETAKDKADAAGTYTGTITVTASEGYALAEGVTYTVNEKSATAPLTVELTVKAADSSNGNNSDQNS